MKILNSYRRLLCVMAVLALSCGGLRAQEVCETTLQATCCNSELPYLYHGQPFTQSGIYDVHLTSASGCDSVVHLHLTVFTNPIVTVSGDLSFCDGQSTTLTASGGQSYEWKKSFGPNFWFPPFSEEPSVVLTEGGIYMVTATDAHGCTASQQINVTTKNLPDGSIAYDTNEVCEGTSVLLSANGAQGYTYLWSTGATDRQISVNTSGTYVLRVTANGCTVVNSVVITVHPTPDISFVGQDQLCLGDTVTLYALSSLATSYLWNTNATDSAIRVYENGVYSVTVQSAFGCVNEDSVTVLAQPYPIVAISGPSTACAGSEVILTAFGTAADYSWSTGDVTDTLVIHPTASGSYQVTAYTANHVCATTATAYITVNEAYDITIVDTLCSSELPFVFNGVPYMQSGIYDIHLVTSNGCDSLVHLNLTVLEGPEIAIIGDSLICPGATALLYANSNTSFYWNTGETYSPISVNSPGWYVLTAMTSNGCQSVDSMYVAYRPDMGLTVSGNRSFCEGQSTTLTASGGQSYTWEIEIPNYGRFPFSEEAEVTLYEGGIFVVTATDVYGCSSSQQLNITKTNLPNASIFTDDYDQMVCEGTGIQLNANWSQGNSYLWSTGSTAPQITIYTPGTYALQVTREGCTAVDSIAIDMYPLPATTFSGDTLICRYRAAMIYASAPNAVRYLWNTGDTLNYITLPSVTATSAYWVSVENTYGCVKTDTVLVRVEDIPQAYITGPDSVCEGGAATLRASGGVRYRWDNNCTTAERTISGPGLYSVTVTTAGGCWANAQKRVYQYEAPDVNIVGRSHICSGDSVQLTIPGLVSCVWSNGSADTVITVYEAGVYWVEGWEAHACYVMDTMEVEAATSPTVQIMGDSVGCFDSMSFLTANAPAAVSFLWNNGDTTAQIQVNETALYSVMVSDSNFCHASDSFYFEVRQAPPCSILGRTEICQGDTTTLTASAGDHFLWSTGDTTSSILVAPNSTQSYTLMVQHENGCYSFDSVQVLVHESTPIAIQGDDYFCEGDSVLLVADADGDLVWSTGQNGDSIWVHETGDYSVWKVDSNACMQSSVKHVAQYQMPTLQITGVSYLCVGDTGILYAEINEPVSYQWTTGDTSSSIQVISFTNVYGVTVTNAYGCTASATKLLMAYSRPTVGVDGPTSICNGDTVPLVATGSATRFQWSTGDTTSSVVVSPRYTTTYQVVGSNDYGCTASASLLMTVHSKPTVSISGDTILCQGESGTLTCTNASSFLWSTGSTERSISISETGVYSVVVSNMTGCSNSASVNVHVYDHPNLTILGDTVICQGEQTGLLAIGGDTYLWSDGSTTPGIMVSPASSTVYTVQAFNGVCMSEMSRVVVVNEKPTAVIVAPDGICEGSTVTLEAHGGLAYLWSTGQSSAMINVQSAGIYRLVAFSQNGCSDTAYHQLIQYPQTQVSITGSSALCPNEQGVLTAIGNGSYQWSTGDTSASITISTPGYYQLQMTDVNGCVASASQNVTSLLSPTVIINGPYDMCENNTVTLSVLCPNATSFSWNTGAMSNSIEVSPSVTTTYTVIAVSADNCISQQSHTLNVHSAYQTEFSAEICQGQSYSGQGFTIPIQQEAGVFTYTQTWSTMYYCDSVRILHLTVNPVPVITGEIYGNAVINSPGNYVYMIDSVENATSYEWTLSNPNWTVTYNHTVAQVSVLYPGSATLSVYALNSCGQSIPVSMQLTYGTGVDDVDMSSLQVFPNPTTGVVNVQYMNLEQLDKVEIQLFDMYGKMLNRWEMSGENMELDLSSYTAGIYLLKMLNTQNAVESTVKIVKR